MQLALKQRRQLQMHGDGDDGDGDMAMAAAFLGIGTNNAARSSSSRRIAALFVALAVLGLLGFINRGDGRSRGLRVVRVLAATKSGSLVPLACSATRYRQACISSLGNDSRSASASPEQIIQIAVDISSRVSSRSLELTSGLLGSRARGDKNLTEASEVCVQVLRFAARRFDQCKSSLGSGGGASFSTRAVKDSEAWLSAALAFQYDCWSALSYVNSSKEVQQIMDQVETGMLSISNALSMVDAFDLYGPRPSDWKPPPSKRAHKKSAVPTAEWLSHDDHRLLVEQLGKLEIKATVSKDGSSGFTSVQQAINSAPDNAMTRYVIHVKEGIYRERVVVPLSKTMILLFGDGINKTVITGSEYVRDGVTTMNTYTILVAGDGFMARDITVENTAGPELHQAVAVRIDADQVAFQSCSFVGFQDTLYSHTLRHYFRDSIIMGTVDFIFGNAAAVFDNCSILVRPGRKGVTTSMVSAHGRIDPAQTTGFAFNNCSVDASKDFLPVFNSDKKKYRTYLGRPWKEYSRSVYLGCYLGAIVPPEGWLAWKGDFALDTLYFGEYQSRGPGGSDASQRVSWSTQMTASDVPAYSTQNFLQGPEWGIS